jgi:hypothetical protein
MLTYEFDIIRNNAGSELSLELWMRMIITDYKRESRDRSWPIRALECTPKPKIACYPLATANTVFVAIRADVVMYLTPP